MNKIISTLLLASLPLGLSSAQTQGEAASIMSQALYCRTFEMLSGDIGLIAGLLIGFVGFLILILKEFHASGFILILAGVCLTALPAFFESSLSGITGMAASSGMGNQTFDSTETGYQHLKGGSGNGSSCDHLDAALQLQFIKDNMVSNGTTNALGQPIDPWTGEALGDGFSNTDSIDGTSYTQAPSDSCVAIRNSNASGYAGSIIGGGGRLTSCHGTRGTCNGVCTSNHRGVDFAGPTVGTVGTPILSYASGTVVKAGFNGGLGYSVEVDHGNGTSTVYSHMQSNLSVSVGQNVAAGSTLGGLGNTGNSTNAHLDFRVKINGSYVDPCKHTNVCSQ